MQYEELERKLLSEIDETQDSLRFYRLTEPADTKIKEYGNFRAIDFEGTLIV
jgi:CRISPR-associated protein Cas2